MRRFLYPAPKFTPGTTIPGLVRLASPDDAFVYRAAQEGKPTVVFCHGNGSDVSTKGCFVDMMTAAGLGAVIPEYPGYGPLSHRKPSQEAILTSVRQCFEYLSAQGIESSNVTLVGESLGSSVAAHMAHEGRCAALVLMSAFTSIDDMYRKIVPWYPRSWVPDHFRTLDIAPSITVPTLLLHGADDTLVPPAMSDVLHKALSHSERHVIDGLHHGTIWHEDGGCRERIIEFAQQHSSWCNDGR